MFNRPFKFSWLKGYICSSSYHHHQTRLNLSHSCHTVPCLCVWGDSTIIFHQKFQIYPHTAASITTVQFVMSSNYWVHYGLKVIFVCVHIILPHHHNYVDISESTEHIKCLSSIFCHPRSMCLRLNQFYQLSSMQYMGLCVFSLPISLVMMVRIYELYLIIIIKLEVWITSHCFGLDHETMVCAVFLTMFS